MTPKSTINRILPVLPNIIDKYGTAVFIYDELGIRKNAERMMKSFSGLDFKQYFAVKACPNIHILKIMKDLGFGFDCSSPFELSLARIVGATPDDIMFTSNNTSVEMFRRAQEHGGSIINVDDINQIKNIPPPFPELMSFRYNPGKDRSNKEGGIFDDPSEEKFGVPEDDLLNAYRMAQVFGAWRFGLHTMIVSNELDYQYHLETIKMLLSIVMILKRELGIQIEFMNIGGGIGIPYKPDDKPFDIKALGLEATKLCQDFKKENGFVPQLCTESGRYITGPYGVLATRVINRMKKYKTFIGVDSNCLSSLVRPAMYGKLGGGYHHITFVDRKDLTVEKDGGDMENVTVVGSMCEGTDRFAFDRDMVKAEIGDVALCHDAGAHTLAMSGNYNSGLRPPEVLVRPDGSYLLISRRETEKDLFQRMRPI